MTTYSPQWKEKPILDPYVSRDMEYFQAMYPQRIKELQRYVVQHCDTLDYAGSPIYDEYPDSLVIDRACRIICQNLPDNLAEPDLPGSTIRSDWAEEREEAGETDSIPVEIMQRSPRPGGPPPGHRPGPPPGGPPFGPPPGGPPFGPPPGGPPFGPPPGGPPFGPPPGGPPFGPPPRGGSWLSDIVKVLFMNELQRRRCRTGRC